ncbi:SDR family NAD(P)-dependent oxidoreductase [Herbiconiux sp. KACC 21604]|uniref:NAD-dependent epimerase/dehydratase family protein n=1 Tax=unclassified Herbiconiux TaxID=2618217 RepID=UPI0014930CF2|nr:SDR family NAD(P)-dependent oxidoreductase [Herbiconiux sp. SALV-R1]QJU54421.1 SDR family NAD(P)-dependent oxidoreductase [Herbiconiux sp. SALV-R1]WPO85495.1 SDR family NAD(P)-dependent oxidoreductase [Herbiconiux sp. KACC 21604]
MTDLSRQRVIVTGGAGFIGCALAERLAGKAEKWVVVDSLHPQVHQVQERPAALVEAAELIVGDVTDPAVWETVLAEIEPTVVIHLAAETGTAQSLNEATRHAHVNVVGTTVMLDALSARGIVPERFLLSSSRAVYGEGAWEKSSGEVYYPGQRSHAQFEAAQWDFPDAKPLASRAAVTVPAPTSVYGSTKLAQEHVLSAWVNARDTTLTTLRLQNVYGPGQSLSNPYTGIVSLFSQLAQRGESIPIYEDGLITRDFVYIDDVADAFVAALALPAEEASIVGDVGSGVGTTIMQLAEAIAAYHQAPAPHITGKYRDGDVRHAECTIDDTLRMLDWEPRWPVDRGVAGLQSWIAEQTGR